MTSTKSQAAHGVSSVSEEKTVLLWINFKKSLIGTTGESQMAMKTVWLKAPSKISELLNEKSYKNSQINNMYQLSFISVP